MTNTRSNRRAFVGISAGTAAAALAGQALATTPEASPRATPQATPGGTPGATPEATNMAVRLTIGEETQIARLVNNASARDFLTLLPLTSAWKHYGGQEILTDLPRPLDVTGMPEGSAAERGDLGWYAPDQVLVIYYEPVTFFNGIHLIGRIEGSLDAFQNLEDGTEITIDAESGA